jgi:hypothetical protein
VSCEYQHVLSDPESDLLSVTANGGRVAGPLQWHGPHGRPAGAGGGAREKHSNSPNRPNVPKQHLPSLSAQMASAHVATRPMTRSAAALPAATFAAPAHSTNFHDRLSSAPPAFAVSAAAAAAIQPLAHLPAPPLPAPHAPPCVDDVFLMAAPVVWIRDQTLHLQVCPPRP